MQDLNDKITGGTLSADEWNEVPSEIQNVIEALSIVLSGADLNQLGKAIAGYVANGNSYTDSGAANAYVLTTIGSKQSPTAYTSGMVINFTTANVNTGATTVNVASLGVKNIRRGDGTMALSAGDILAGQQITATYDGTQFVIALSGQVKTTVITSSNPTFTPDPLAKAIKFTAIGSGGGGGGADGQGPSTAVMGGGAGGGGSSIIIPNVIDATYAVVIGSGGAGGAGTGGDGVDGGDTTVISTSLNISGGGGEAGNGMVGTSGNSVDGLGGFGGVATGGDLNISGGDGDTGVVTSGGRAQPGNSGDSLLGGGRRGQVASTGLNGVTAGSGGSGAGGASNTDNRGGGDGADGAVIVEEFF